MFSKGMLLQALKKDFDNYNIRDEKTRTNNNQVAEVDQTNVALFWIPCQSAALFISREGLKKILTAVKAKTLVTIFCRNGEWGFISMIHNAPPGRRMRCASSMICRKDSVQVTTKIGSLQSLVRCRLRCSGLSKRQAM
jgi:hypothetical protein